MSVDIDNDKRDKPDMGADEYVPLPLYVSSRDSALLLNWGINPSLMPSLHHYELTVQCQIGANPPNEIGCGQTFDLGTKTVFLLTGLSNYKNYTLSVTSKDQAGAILEIFRTVTAFHTDIYVFLPLLIK